MSIPGTPGPIPPNSLPGQGQTPGADSANPAAKSGQTSGVAFGQHMEQAGEPAGATAPPHGTQGPNEAMNIGGIDPLQQANGIRDEIASIRDNLEQMKASGKIDESDGQLQLWRMLDLQTRVQDVHFRVELVTKVVEQGTSGIKQISQTQA